MLKVRVAISCDEPNCNSFVRDEIELVLGSSFFGGGDLSLKLPLGWEQIGTKIYCADHRAAGMQKLVRKEAQDA